MPKVFSRWVKSCVRRTLEAAGLEMRRATPSTSERIRLGRTLTHHDINVVLDVGANVGQYAMFLRRAGYDGRVVSFEPLSDAHRHLTRAAAKDRRWEVADRMALSDREAMGVLNVSGNSVSSSLLRMLPHHEQCAPGSSYVRTEEVKLMTLDSVISRYCSSKDRVLLKLDVQGYERFVLDGAEKSLSMINGIQAELSLTELYEGETTFWLMHRRLESLGFVLYSLTPGFTDLVSARMLQVDGLFFRDAVAPESHSGRYRVR